MKIIQCDKKPLSNPDVQEVLRLLRSGGITGMDETSDLDIPGIVSDILSQVKTGGNQAAAELTSRLDNADISPGTIPVRQDAVTSAHSAAKPEFLTLIRKVIGNIREYQAHILIPEPAPFSRGARRLGVRYTPIERVGVYVPGGKALYPSTVLMTIVPAQVAGVKEIVMVSPPTGGEINPMALALAGELGITEVYQLGGAVAIGALAYGTETIKPVDKIVGPGNAFVAEAKRQLFGVVGIDSIAGPSEVLIVADDTARPEWLAADILAQAEHDPGSGILLTPSATLADRVEKEIASQMGKFQRAEAIRSSIDKYSALIVTPDLDTACSLAKEFAAEHLQIVTRDNDMCLKKIPHAGAVFIGPHTPVSLGDYYAGPSHVLPTGGTSKFFGPLSCNDFRKATSTIEYDPQGLQEDAAHVADFANFEGLTAHAETVNIRLRKSDDR